MTSDRETDVTLDALIRLFRVVDDIRADLRERGLEQIVDDAMAKHGHYTAHVNVPEPEGAEFEVTLRQDEADRLTPARTFIVEDQEQP